MSRVTGPVTIRAGVAPHARMSLFSVTTPPPGPTDPPQPGDAAARAGRPNTRSAITKTFAAFARGDVIFFSRIPGRLSFPLVMAYILSRSRLWIDGLGTILRRATRGLDTDGGSA